MLAGLIWGLVGVLLMLRGLAPYWLEIAEQSLGAGVALLAASLLVGWAKGWFVLRRAAGRIIAHIETQQHDGRLWNLYPPRLLVVIPLMVLLGVGLRAGFGDSLPALVAAVYLGIGAALMASALPFFRYWRTGPTGG